MTRKSQLLTIGIVFLAGLLLGFVPQYVEKHRLRAQLDESADRVATANTDLRMSQLRDLSGLMLLEVLQQNYGSAKNYATQYFERLRQETGRTENPATKKKLEELLQRRDEIISSLAQGDPSSAVQIQSLFARTHEAARSE